MHFFHVIKAFQITSNLDSRGKRGMRVNLSHAWSPHDWNNAPCGPAEVAPASTTAITAAITEPADSEWMLLPADDLCAPWVTVVLRGGRAPA